MVVRFLRTGWFLLVSHRTSRSLFKNYTKIFRYGSGRAELLFWMEILRSGDGQQHLPRNHWRVCHLWKSPSCTFFHPSDSSPDGLFLSFHCNRLQGYDSDNGSAGVLWNWDYRKNVISWIYLKIFKLRTYIFWHKTGEYLEVATGRPLQFKRQLDLIIVCSMYISFFEFLVFYFL